MSVKFVSRPIFETSQGHLLKYIQEKSDQCFHTFGESYFSWLNPGIVKGWYKHKKSQSFMTSPTCNLHLAVFNEKESYEFKLTKDNFGYVIIPSGYYYAMKSLNESPTLIANTLDCIHDPNEVEKKDVATFEDWFIYA